MNEAEERFSRLKLFTGEAGFAKLQRSHVLVLGLGGVGAFAAEEIARAGIGSMTLIDGDVVEKSNCNRQLPALTGNFGRSKADVMAERIRQINPAAELTVKNEFLRLDAIDALLDGGTFDYAVDAIDQLEVKTGFILGCRRRKIPLISSMGAGGKSDPGQIRIADISRTEGDALARAVRKRLKEAGVTKGVKVVYSPQEVPKSAIEIWRDDAGHRHAAVGTVSYLPAVFGCFCASAVIRGLLEK